LGIFEIICNHIHILLEVPPLAAGGLSDGELLQRLKRLYNSVMLVEMAKRLKRWRHISI